MATESKLVLDPGTPIDWKAELPQADIDILEYRYVNHIEAVRTLDAEEALLFKESGHDFLNMMVQQQFRLKSRHSTPPDDDGIVSPQGAGEEMVISPLRLEQKLRRFIREHKALRTSYYTATDGTVCAVECNEKIPLHNITLNKLTGMDEEAVAAHLNRVMNANRHCPIRLDSPFLPRMQFYSLSPSEYAVVVSQPLLLASRWNPQGLLASLLHPEDVELVIEEGSLPSPSQYLETGVKTAFDTDFWEKFLQDFSTQPRLPGYTRPRQTPHLLRVERLIIPAEVMASLNAVCPTEDRRRWVALLTTLWGLALQNFSKSSDVFFPVLMPEEDNHLHVNKILFAHRPMPCRVKAVPFQLVGDLVSQQYQTMMKAIGSGTLSPGDVMRLTKQEGSYNHILSFRDFLTVEVLNPPTECGITASSCHLSSLNHDLCIDFQMEKGVLSLEVTYYEEALSVESVKAILDRYVHTMDLVSKYWQAMCSELSEATMPMHHRALNERQHEMLLRILSKSPMLANVPTDQVKSMLSEATVYELPCHEVVQTVGSHQSDILVLISGSVLRQRNSGEGWMVPLNIIGPGDMVDEFTLVEETSKIYAEVVSDKAVIVAIPRPFIRHMLQQTNDFSLDMAGYLLGQLDMYQRLWLTV